MKKLITLICAFVIGSISFSQKNEIKAIEKALKKNNFAEAKSVLAAADALIGSMDDKSKAKYYFLKAKALYANGTASDADFDASIISLDNLKELESKMGKLKYTQEANTIKVGMLQNVLQTANKAYTSKDFASAESRFHKAYMLSPKDTLYLYYAASSAVSAQDYDKALPHYKELKHLGFTGIRTEFLATKVETGVEEAFPDKLQRDLSVKTKQYIKPKDSKTKSLLGEIVKNVALIYVSQDRNEEALAAMADARAQNPDDIGLLLSQANVYLKMGNRDKFKDLMEEATVKDPNNAELLYNLGVLSAEGGNNDKAKEYYTKAIELKPDHTDSYINMASVILNGEAPIVEEMNGLGNSSADNRRYDELKEKRSNLYREAIPFLEKALELKKNNVDAARTLMNIYSSIGETDKFKAMKQKIADIEAGN